MADIKIGQTAGISVVDFGPFLDGSRKQEVADAIIVSFKEIGFVYLVNHGLETHKVNGMFDWVRPFLSRPTLLLSLRQSKRFFAQPQEVKLLAPHPVNGAHHRGSLLWEWESFFETLTDRGRVFCTRRGKGRQRRV